MTGFVKVSAKEFERILQTAHPRDELVLLDVYAERGCDICTTRDALKAIEAEYGSSWHLVRMDADASDSQALLGQYRIRGIPTLALFKPNGQVRKFIDVPDPQGDNVLKWLAEQALA